MDNNVDELLPGLAAPPVPPVPQHVHAQPPPPVQQQQQIPPVQFIPPGNVPLHPAAAPFVPGAAWPPAAPLAPPVKVVLTEFWEKQPEAWFNLADSEFERLGVWQPRLRFNFALHALPKSLVEQLGDLLRAAPYYPDPYAVLRQELISRFTPCIQEQLNKIVFAPELGGQAPSELLRSMLASLPPGEPPGLLFRHLFVLKLPADLRDAVGRRIAELTPQELAFFADQRWHSRNNTKPPDSSVPVAALLDLSLDETPTQVAAISSQQRHKRGGKQRRGGRGGGADGGGSGGGKSDAGSWICLPHTKYGDKAYSCADAKNCRFPGNGGAGTR